LLERCLKFAHANQYNIQSVDEVLANASAGTKPSRPTICFTLDDGYIDQTSELIPLLLKFKAKPTLYVLSDFVSGVDWPWDAKITYLIESAEPVNRDFFYENKRFYLDFSSRETRVKSRRRITEYAKTINKQRVEVLIRALAEVLACKIPVQAPLHFQSPSWKKLKDLESEGLIVGAHGVSHQPLASLSDAQAKFEITESKRVLGAELNYPSNTFCYSSGTNKDYAPKHADMVRQAGYLGAVSAISGNQTLQEIQKDSFNIRRHSFPSTFSSFVRYSSWFEFLRSKIG
jgi:peptidoglycan/xylan/chitin deacetylase (PgdA/CDA1 family)